MVILDCIVNQAKPPKLYCNGLGNLLRICWLI